LKRVLSVDGPRGGWALSLLQREVLAADLVTDLTGISCHMSVPEETGNMVRRADLFSTMVAAEIALYLQPMLLLDADCFSMASSVELRVPFVTAAFLSLAGSGGRHRRTPGKAFPRGSTCRSIPQEVGHSSKLGFSVPMRRWMSGPLAPALAAAHEPDCTSLVGRGPGMAARAGLTGMAIHDRWAETWALAALNAWLLSVVDKGAS